jgi:hypothetical protein
MRIGAFCLVLFLAACGSAGSVATSTPAATPTPAATGTPPSPTTLWPRATNLVYDSSRGQVLLFGGFAATVTNDTWTWDGTRWTLHTSAANPSARQGAALADDLDHHVVVLFGGGDPSNPLADTWLWNGSGWTRATPAHSPSPRTQASMAYDSVHHVTVLFGGYGVGNDTWTWDGVDWSQKSPAASPPGRLYGRLTFDVARGNLVLFGGFDGLNDTWTWDGSTWTQQHPASTPPGLREATPVPAQMAYDVARRVIVFVDPTQHSALSSDNTMDTWIWNGMTWTRLPTTASPPPRDGYGLAYDAARSITVFAGGLPFGDANANSTWGWDGVNWSAIG